MVSSSNSDFISIMEEKFWVIYVKYVSSFVILYCRYTVFLNRWLVYIFLQFYFLEKLMFVVHLQPVI